MTRNGEIERLTKGIYCKFKVGRFGRLVSSEKQIQTYYLGKNGNHGVVVGYRMYNKYKLTTQISNTLEIYSNISAQENKKILNVEVKKINLKLDTSLIKMIELLNFLENFHNIEELNREYAYLFIEEAISFYCDKTLKKLVDSIGYKKSTLASLKNILDYYKINNTVDKYLNSLSKYRTFSMESFHELTPKQRIVS